MIGNRTARALVRVALTVLALALPLAGGALTWNGQGQPNDPNYAPAESDQVPKCINDEQWPWFVRATTRRLCRPRP